jgi:hypothetical protein
VGSKTLGIASLYLRAVCQNRNLWGVEDFEEITIRHSKYAAARFAHEAAPALESFANSSPEPFVAGIKAARERVVAHTDDDRSDFLRKRGFSKSETGRIIETVLREEGRPPESLFDFVQGITAVARARSIKTPGSSSSSGPSDCSTKRRNDHASPAPAIGRRRRPAQNFGAARCVAPTCHLPSTSEPALRQSAFTARAAWGR